MAKETSKITSFENDVELSKYSVKLGRPNTGHEGEYCATGSLLKDGNEIAHFEDNLYGGPISINFADDAEEKALWTAFEGKKVPCDFFPEGLTLTLDLFVGLLVEEN